MTMTGTNGNLNTNKNNFPTTVILVDFNTSLDSVLSLIDDHSKIISFDFESHKALLEKKIKHMLSDDFTNEIELAYIQKQAYYFLEWYEHDSIKNYIEYEGINLGKLFCDEIFGFIVQFLKKFHEMYNIYNSYPNAKFITADPLYDIIHSFTDSVAQIKKLDKNYILAHERVRFNFKLGKRYFIIFLSRSSYQKLKGFSEKIIHFLFGPKKDFNKKGKTTLLVEFNTTRFKDFFLSASNWPLNLMFYGRRRPAIWNMETYSIIKQSKCKVITLHALSSKDLYINAKKNTTKIIPKIKSLWENDQIFDSFFSFKNLSIWKFLKPILVKLIEQRIYQTIFEIELTKKLFNKFHFDSILVMSEIGFIEQIIINQAKKLQIPVIHLQEGLTWDTLESYNNKKSQGAFPIDADYFIVWGKISEKDAIVNGKTPTSKIKVFGSPRYDSFLVNSKNENSNEYILLATAGPQREDIHGLDVYSIEKYESDILQICKIISNKQKKLIVKLHPSPTELDVTNLIKNINPQIKVVTTGDILPLIESCSILIVMGMSTAILEGQIFHKPVVSIQSIDYKWGEPEIYKSKSCVVCKIEEFENYLDLILFNKQFKEELLQHEHMFLEKYLSNQGSASKTLLDFLTKI